MLVQYFHHQWALTCACMYLLPYIEHGKISTLHSPNQTPPFVAGKLHFKTCSLDSRAEIHIQTLGYNRIPSSLFHSGLRLHFIVISCGVFLFGLNVVECHVIHTS